MAALGPALLLEVLFFFIPLSMLFLVSMTKKESFFFEPIYTFDNYFKVFDNFSFDFQNTLTLVGSAAFLDVAFGIPFAYLMARKIRRFGDLFRAILLIPLFGELYIAYGLWYVFLPKGPLAFIFEALGIPVFEALYSAPSAVLGLAIYTFPFVVYNIGISLQAIEPSIEQSARCLGAGPLSTFFRITLPLALPGIISGWLISFGWNLGAYAIPVLMGGVVTGSRVLAVQLYTVSLVTSDFGLGAALGVVIVAIAVLIFYLSLKLTKGVLV
jgi:ABC-type spermidine/putrescine transport system permease subunit I